MVPLKGLERLSRWAVCGSTPYQRSRQLAERVLRRLDIDVRKEKERDGGLLWVLARCPFCGKTDGATHVEARHDGTLCFSCKHNSCRPGGGRYTWSDLRARYEAVGGEDYTPPRRAEAGERE